MPTSPAPTGRAIDDPVKLARAARIIRTALARKRLQREGPAR